jgi:competence protein ComEC
LAKALLIADQTEIPKEIKDRYANAGIVHMLSISGLHVAIIAMAVELFASLLRVPKMVGTVATVGVIMVYVAVIGFPPPAVRSGVMLAGMAASRVAQRPTSRWATLALGAWLPLMNPATVLDLGYQLSVGGIAGLIASGALAKRWLGDKLSGWRATLARSLLASSVATIVSGPLVAYAFGRISIVAPLTNLVADPIVGLVQPLLFLALVIAPVRSLARFVADGVHPVLAAFDLVARAGAAVPYATIAVAPSLTAALVAGVAAIAIIIACVSRYPARPALAAAVAVSMLPWVA